MILRKILVDGAFFRDGLEELGKMNCDRRRNIVDETSHAINVLNMAEPLAKSNNNFSLKIRFLVL